MKNCEEFRASVYARAQVRKNETAARKIKIRNTVLSVMVVAVAAAATVPIARRGRLFPPATEPPPNKAQQVVVGRLQLENVRDKQLVAVVEKENKTPGFAVLNSSAKQKAFVRQYKTVNHLNETQDIAMSPVYGEAKTVHSAEELNEYLDALPQSTALLRQIASFYGDAFFSANDLCVMPLSILPEETETTALATELTTQPETEPLLPPVQQEPLPAVVLETIPDAVSQTDADSIATQTEDTADAETLPYLDLQASDVTLLLLSPVERAQQP